MTYTDNLYLKRMAEKLSGPITGRHTNNFYLKIISEHINKGGGGGYDDTAIKRRITAVENGKQDKLTAGYGILIDGNSIAAKNIIDDTKNSLTTVWSSNKVKSLFESIQGGVDIVITTTLPDKSLAVEKTMYYVGATAPYHIWFFLDDEWEDFGTTEISLENYYTKSEVNELLDLKVDKETGKVLIPLEDLAQITTNKNDIADLDSEKVDKENGKVLIPTEDLAQITTNKNDIADLEDDKQDKITDSTLSELADATTISSVSASSKTNKTFALSALWDWIVGKLTSNTEKGIQVSSGKLGHSNAITVPTAKRILQATYDAQGHVTAIENEFNWSNTYSTTAENQLFTRKGAYNLWTAAKSAANNESADVTLTCSSMQNNFVFQKTYARKIANNVYLICFNLYKSSGSVSANTEVKIAGDTTPLKVDGKNINQFVGQAVYVPDSHAISITYNGNTLWAESGGKAIGNGAANNIRVNAIVYTTS